MNTAGRKRALGEFPPLPAEYTEDVVFADPGGYVELRCAYGRNKSIYSCGVRFQRVRAFQFRAEPYCTAWHVVSGLIEVEQSGWIRELLADEPPQFVWPWPIRHFLVYIEDAGAYEIAAADVEWLPEELVS